MTGNALRPIKRLREHPYYEVPWFKMPRSVVNDVRVDAYQWCKENIKAGDSIIAARCGGWGRFTVTGWDGGALVSRTADDISPLCVLKVNGKFVFPFGSDASVFKGYIA